MIERIDHLIVAVADLDTSESNYTKIFGHKPNKSKTIEKPKPTLCDIRNVNSPAKMGPTNAVIFPDKVNIPKPNPCVLSGVRLAMTTLLEL